MYSASLISVVDDDQSVRESLEGLLKILGYRVEAFTSAENFLGSDRRTDTDCLILDICLPGMSGLDLQSALVDRGLLIPVIFITSHTETEVVSRVMANGAVACLSKPFSEDSLLQAISECFSA